MRLSIKIGFWMVTGVLLAGIAHAETRPVTDPQQNGILQTPAQPTATLQITEKAGRFTLSADRADVQATLKLLFDQAERQFTLDSSVAGMVTMRLTGQPFRTVLQAICQQTFLRYDLDANTGIYRFERNEAAIRAAFSRFRNLNNDLRAQLRGMGYDVPDNVLSNIAGGAVLSLGTSGMPMAGRGGFAGGTGGQPGMTGAPNRARSEQRSSSAGNNAQKEKAEPFRGADQSNLAADALNSSALQNGENYQNFLSQNGLVSFNIPKERPVPVTDLLMQLGRQANASVLIDSSVPTGSKFRIGGNISPRPLADMLNVLAPTARLEWRIIDNRYYITAAPDFYLYFGDSTLPRASNRQQMAPALRSSKQATPVKPDSGDSSEKKKEKTPEKP